MPKKQITISIKQVDAEYWHTVKQFALHRRMTVKALVLAAVDEYITRHKEKERKQRKEVSLNGSS